MLSVTINGSVTLDETAGLQNGGTGTSDPGGDNNDSDVPVGQLPTAFSNRLFNSPANGGLGLSQVFPTSIGVAKSADNFIAITANGTVVSLGFSQTNGSALPIDGSGSGVSSGLNSLDAAGAINLFADAAGFLGNRMVIGRDGNGVSVAMFMEPTNAGLTAARVWTVQLEPLKNGTDPTQFDDPVAAAGLGVAAGVSTEFNFNALPSGQNLFGTVGSTSTALVVIGKTPDLNADGSFTNASNTINTSQGGGPTTIGVNNQMFDPGDGAYFTFVTGPTADFLAGAPGGLDQGEADLAGSIEFKKRLEVTGGFVKIAQIQGNSAASMKVTLFNGGDSDNIDNNDDERVFTDTGLGTGTKITITKITVFNASGGVVQTINNPIVDGNGAVTVTGLQANFRVAWEATGLHDQVLIEGTAGKFDIGGFGADLPGSELAPLNTIRFEDDGPGVDVAQKDQPVSVDETDLTVNGTKQVEATDLSALFGTDGAGVTNLAFEMVTAGGDSGLKDTATGFSVFLFQNGTSQIVGKAGSTELLAQSGPTVFVLSVNSTGLITLDQQRAIVHPNTNSHDETLSKALADALKVTGTVTDKDGDAAVKTVFDSVTLHIDDDGPSITGTIVNAPLLTVDETNLAGNDTKDFSQQFTSAFGNDGAGATGVSYALSTAGGASGLTDTATGESVVLSLVSGQILGKTATTGLTVFVVSVDATGKVTLDQQRSVVHANPNDPDESRGLSGTGLVVLTGTATDKDADHAEAPLDITPQLAFKDDGPAIGPVASSVVDFVSGATVSKSLNGIIGNDPNTGTRYTVDSFTTSVTTNGVLVKGVASANNTVVTYFADTNNDTIFGNAGDTAFYRLTLSQAGSGTYTFDVLVSPPPAEVSFNFGDLPSGQNLFGMIGDPTTGLIILGKESGNTINTSQGGGGTTIGIDNQMFDPTQGAFFTFVKEPREEFLGPQLSPGEADVADNMRYDDGTLEVTNGFLNVVQRQGGGQLKMRLSAFDLAGAPQGDAFLTAVRGNKTPVNITQVKVNGTIVFTGSAAFVDVNINAGDEVSWTTAGVHDVVLVEGVSGKFDIGGFGTTQTAPTPDQKLDFVVRATDGDTDFATAGFSIGIDGTGIFDDGVVTGVTVSNATSLFSSASIDELAALLA